MTDQLDHHKVPSEPPGPFDIETCRFDYCSLRQYILEHSQSIVTTVMLIDAGIVATCQKVLGLGPTEYLPRTAEQMRTPIIAIVDDESGRLIDVDDYGCILARAARGMRTIGVHRIRYEYARAYHRLGSRPAA